MPGTSFLLRMGLILRLSPGVDFYNFGVNIFFSKRERAHKREGLTGLVFSSVRFRFRGSGTAKNEGLFLTAHTRQSLLEGSMDCSTEAAGRRGLTAASFNLKKKLELGAKIE